MNSPHISFPPTPPELRLKRATDKSSAGFDSASAMQDEIRLAAAWEKLHRARALLEVEQGQLCRERAALDQARVEMHRREAALAAREAAVAAAEAHRKTEEPKPKSLFGFTRAPFGLGKSTAE
ncbi:MAG: hypothetical protein H7A44_03655 [Opitutaceae bacterium]|nr:hypothetical protein [Cephaloticoccus sp.]MCP5529515.1 hypothetical protein [Opitutaceae bacterium]